MRGVFSLVLLGGCFYPQDVALSVPDVAGARSIAIAIRDGDDTTLTTYDLDQPIRFTLEQEDERRIEVAALLYDQSLAEEELPQGTIPLEGEGQRSFPFERGFETVVEARSGSWSELSALPEWLSSVRLPHRVCRELDVSVEAFGQTGDRAKGMACSGGNALVPVLGEVARYYSITGDSLTELSTAIPSTFRPRDVAARLDGRFVIAGIDSAERELQLWIGDRIAGFVKTATRAPVAGSFRIEVGRSIDDEDQVYLMSELGEVLRFNGRRWSRLRARVLTERRSDDRYGMAWVEPETVAVFGPVYPNTADARLVTILSPGTSTVTVLDEPIFSLTHLEEHGTLAGTSTGQIYVLRDARWLHLSSDHDYRWSVISMATFHRQVAFGGTDGRLMYQLESSPCLAPTGGMSLTGLCSLEDELISVNIDLDSDPVLVRVR